MKRKELLQQLAQILEVQTGTLTGVEKLDHLTGWNSFAMASFVALVQDLGDDVAPRRLATCRTVEDLVRLTGIEQ